jgi:5-methyltetrahydrofolate--homocysteine methyltransferase
MIIIGEKINGTQENVAHAIQERDSSVIQNLAKDQEEAGADYLDVNAGTNPEKEIEDLKWLIGAIQKVSEIPLCLDSPNAAALKEGLEMIQGKTMINSLSGESSRIENILPLARNHQTELVILALDDNGVPKTVEGRVDIIFGLINMARKADIPDEMLYIDPLVMAIATDSHNGIIAMETMREVKRECPSVHLTCGISNISYGCPLRSTVNRAFMTLAISCGLDSAIMNPEDTEMLGTIYAAEMLLGKDPYCLNYNRAYRAGRAGRPSGS